MQLMSAENGRSHMFEVSSKPREGNCEKNKVKGTLFWTSFEYCSPAFVLSLSLSHSLLENEENRRSGEQSEQTKGGGITLSSPVAGRYLPWDYNKLRIL